MAKDNPAPAPEVAPAPAFTLSRAERIARAAANVTPHGQVANARPGVRYFGVDTAAPADFVRRMKEFLFTEGYDPLEKPHDEYVVGVPTAELWWMTEAEYAAKEAAKTARR